MQQLTRLTVSWSVTWSSTKKNLRVSLFTNQQKRASIKWLMFLTVNISSSTEDDLIKWFRESGEIYLDVCDLQTALKSEHELRNTSRNHHLRIFIFPYRRMIYLFMSDFKSSKQVKTHQRKAAWFLFVFRETVSDLQTIIRK